MTEQETAEWEEQRQKRHQRTVLEYAEYKKTGIITTKLMIDAILMKERYLSGTYESQALSWFQIKPVAMSIDKIDAYKNIFEGYRWYWGGLRKRVDEATNRYLEGLGDCGTERWSMRTGCWAGRCLITLTDLTTEQQVTLITSEDEKEFSRLEWGGTHMGPMGIQSIEATEKVALSLIKRATIEELDMKPAELAIG